MNRDRSCPRPAAVRRRRAAVPLTGSDALLERVQPISVARVRPGFRRTSPAGLPHRRFASTSAAVTARRYKLVRLLGDNQRFEHGRIFNRLIENGSSGYQARARGLKCNCIIMGEAFGAYHVRWSNLENAE